MTHTPSSTKFREECQKLPDHSMHLYGRMVVTMYLVAQYKDRVKAHSKRLALALERMDRELVEGACNE